MVGTALYGNTMSESLKELMWRTEAQRLSRAVRQLSEILRNGVELSLEEVSNQTGLSVAELIVEKWDTIFTANAHVKSLETRNANLQLAVERLLAEAENMASASARIVREAREETAPTGEEY